MPYPTAIVALDPKGPSTVLKYDVPQPSSYSGRNCIELDFVPQGQAAKDYFNPVLFQAPPAPAVASLSESALAQKIKSDLSLGIMTPGIFHPTPIIANPTYPPPQSSTPIPPTSAIAISADQVANLFKQGYKPKVYQSLFGTPAFKVIPATPIIRPRVLLVESHRISTFLGSYGAGRVLSTTSLLPGEATRISIRSYTKETVTRAQASSILDSFSQESADDFEKTLQSEQSTKQNSSESFEYHAEAEAEGSWGWGSAKVSGGVKGSTNSSREEFAKHTSSATTKHAQKASAKRDVQVNSSSQSVAETGEETEIVREVKNINVSRTLTFVFRQMNQEFITVHHLVDLRLAFFNGDGTKTREYTLPELETLLQDVILPAKQAEVREAIVAEISNIMDYQGKVPAPLDMDNKDAKPRTFVEKVNRFDNAGKVVSSYWRFARDLYSTYADATTSAINGIQGIILAATKNTMRTDGVMVETIIGGGDALDTYSHSLQDEKVRSVLIDNDARQLAIDLVKIGDAKKTKAYVDLLKPAPTIISAPKP